MGMLQSDGKPSMAPELVEETEHILLLSLNLRYKDITKSNSVDVYSHLSSLLST